MENIILNKYEEAIEEKRNLEIKFNDLLQEVNKILSVNLSALNFIKLWNDYVHLLDDVIDEPNNSELTLRMVAICQLIYSHPFYIANAPYLHLVSVLIDNTYADSVLWERSKEEWKIKHADSLRHVAYDMFYAVIYIVAGRDTLRSISSRFREFSHKIHLDDFICLLRDLKTA